MSLKWRLKLRHIFQLYFQGCLRTEGLPRIGTDETDLRTGKSESKSNRETIFRFRLQFSDRLSDLAREDQGDVVGLLLCADPGVERLHHLS